MSTGDEISLHVRRGAELIGDDETAAPSARSGRSGRARTRENLHPSAVRRVTERRVAHLLLRSSSMTRVELSRQTGLSVATIGKIIDNLVSIGVVEKLVSETKPGPTLGRPAEYFGLARSHARHVVVELGVDKTQLAALPIAGPIGDVRTAVFRTSSELDVLQRRLQAAVSMLEVDQPLAVLVSVPGVVDEYAKRVLYSPNLHWTEGTQLFETIARAIPSRLVVVQDVRALALGYLVHSEPNDSYLLVDTNVGVGGALVMDGRLQTGPLPLSAEIGHTPVAGNRRSCGCGGVGCLETLLGRRGLLMTARRRSRIDVRKWSQLVSELAGKAPPDWLRPTLADAARTIAGALNTVGVSKVVLCGDLLELGTGVLEHMAAGINAHAMWGRFGNIRVEAAPRRRLLGLSLAALDRVVLAPSAVEETLRRRGREPGAL